MKDIKVMEIFETQTSTHSVMASVAARLQLLDDLLKLDTHVSLSSECFSTVCFFVFLTFALLSLVF